LIYEEKIFTHVDGIHVVAIVDGCPVDGTHG